MIFMAPGANRQEINEAGEKDLLRIYKGKSNEKTLNDVPVRTFTMGVASSGRACSTNFYAAKYNFY